MKKLPASTKRIVLKKEVLRLLQGHELQVVVSGDLTTNNSKKSNVVQTPPLGHAPEYIPTGCQ
jgi:hypothetical protein